MVTFSCKKVTWMDPVKRDEPQVGGFKGEIHRKKAFIKKQSPSVEKTDEKVASVGKRSKIEWKGFTAWLSKIFTTPSGRLRNQIAALKEKIEQQPDIHSVGYVSDKARLISREPKFATIAKNLQSLATASTPQETARIIQTARKELLTLIPDEGDQWDAELRQELWRLLLLTSCD